VAKAVQEMPRTCTLGKTTLEIVRPNKKNKITHSHALIDSEMSAADQSERAKTTKHHRSNVARL